MNSTAPITVAMLRSRQSPDTTALALAHAAHVQGAGFFFFNPDDVDLAERMIDARFYVDGSWQRHRASFPDVIDNDTYRPRKAEVWEALVGACRMTTPAMDSKAELYRKLRDAGLLADMLIPTVRAEAPEQLAAQIETHRRVVIKPAAGRQGRDVMFIAADDAGYRANYDGRNWRLAPADLHAFYAARIGDRPFLIQKYIESRTPNGAPCDIRIVARRGRSGGWEHLRMVGRIGGGRTIAANLSRGGSACHGVDLLRNRFDRKRADELEERLTMIGRGFPPAFQKLYPGKSFDALGLDIGIDETGRPWLFEVNSFPADTYFEMQDSVPRIGYAIFLARNPQHPDGVDRSRR